MISTVKAFEDISNWSKFKNILTLPVPIPAEEKKLSEIFIFTLLCGASKGFMKAFWGTTKKCENKNLTQFLFQYNFQKCTGRKGLRKETRGNSANRRVKIMNSCFAFLILAKSDRFLLLSVLCKSNPVYIYWYRGVFKTQSII